MFTPTADQARTAYVWPPILAIDPGGSHTGLCVRAGRDALGATTVDCAPRTGSHLEDTDYALAVLDAIDELIEFTSPRIDQEAAGLGVPAPSRVRLAVETLVAPTGTPSKGRRAAVAPRVLQWLPATATVLGAVCGVYTPIRVAPKGNGGWDSVTGQPASLRGRAPTGWPESGSAREHQRSAWAIAGAAHAQSVADLPTQVSAAAAEATSRALPPITDTADHVDALRAACVRAKAPDVLYRLHDLAAVLAGRSGNDPAVARRVIAEYLT